MTRSETDCSSTSPTEGQALDFRPPLVRSTLAARANDNRSRPDRSPSPSLDPAPRSASRLPLDAAPRCLESASTTDVSRHEHPCEAPSLETTCHPPWGNPAGSRLLDPSRPRCFHRSFEPDAGPPLGHPASSGRAIDGAQTGFRPLDNPRCAGTRRERAFARHTPCDRAPGKETAVAFSANGRSRRGEPSDTS